MSSILPQTLCLPHTLAGFGVMLGKDQPSSTFISTSSLSLVYFDEIAISNQGSHFDDFSHPSPPLAEGHPLPPPINNPSPLKGHVEEEPQRGGEVECH